MKTLVLGIALLLGGTALAQTGSVSGPGTAGYTSQSQTTNASGMSQVDQSTTTGTTTSGQTQTGWNSNSGQSSMAMNTTASSGAVVQPDNSNPRRDARGIPVISMAAVVPAGWNGTVATGTGTGGPLLDPNTGQAVSDTGNLPACSRTVTDRCVQAYEFRHRRR